MSVFHLIWCLLSTLSFGFIQIALFNDSLYLSAGEPVGSRRFTSVLQNFYCTFGMRAFFWLGAQSAPVVGKVTVPDQPSLKQQWTSEKQEVSGYIPQVSGLCNGITLKPALPTTQSSSVWLNSNDLQWLSGWNSLFTTFFPYFSHSPHSPPGISWDPLKLTTWTRIYQRVSSCWNINLGM